MWFPDVKVSWLMSEMVGEGLTCVSYGICVESGSTANWYKEHTANPVVEWDQKKVWLEIRIGIPNPVVEWDQKKVPNHRSGVPLYRRYYVIQLYSLCWQIGHMIKGKKAKRLSKPERTKRWTDYINTPTWWDRSVLITITPINQAVPLQVSPWTFQETWSGCLQVDQL